MNVVSFEESIAIETILGAEEPRILIIKLLSSYCGKFPEKSTDLMDFIVSLVKAQLSIKTNKIYQYDDAMKMLLVSRCKSNQVKDKFSFIAAIDVCKLHFPNGHCEMHSEGERRYFNDFVQYLKDHKDEYIDDSWAIDFGCNDYLKMVLEKNK
jgi:hypothetical protein